MCTTCLLCSKSAPGGNVCNRNCHATCPRHLDTGAPMIRPGPTLRGRCWCRCCLSLHIFFTVPTSDLFLLTFLLAPPDAVVLSKSHGTAKVIPIDARETLHQNVTILANQRGPERSGRYVGQPSKHRSHFTRMVKQIPHSRVQ